MKKAGKTRVSARARDLYGRAGRGGLLHRARGTQDDRPGCRPGPAPPRSPPGDLRSRAVDEDRHPRKPGRSPARGLRPQRHAPASDRIRPRHRRFDRARRRGPCPGRLDPPPARGPRSPSGKRRLPSRCRDRTGSSSGARRRPGSSTASRPSASSCPPRSRARAGPRGRRPGRSPASASRTSRDSPGAGDARLLEAFLPQGIRQALDRHPGPAQDEHVPLASHRRPGLAHRDQEISEADRDRRLARRPGGRALERPEAAAAGRGRDLRRLLHPGRHPRDRRLRRGPLHHDRARDRDARPRQGRPGGLSGVLVHGRTLHRHAGRRTGPSRTSSAPATTARSRSWRTSWPRWSSSSRAPSSTSAATRPTRPSGSTAPSARPG